MRAARGWLAGSVVAVMVLAGACSGGHGSGSASKVTPPGGDVTTAPPGNGSAAARRAPGQAPAAGSQASAGPADPLVFDPGQVVGVASVPASVTPGETATATFRTRPGSTCQMDLQFAGGSGADDQRLEPATADVAGQVSWTWKVASDAAPGDAHAFVVCSGGARGEASIKVS